MKSNIYGEIILSIDDALNALYSGKVSDLSCLNLTDAPEIEKFNQALNANFEKFKPLTSYSEPTISIKEYDQIHQTKWFMPDEYREFDIINWLFDQCTNQEQQDRVALEIELFAQHGMYEVLLYLKYFVDTMRENNIIWGVGRGSSVASYCLFLIGVHKIDSIKYELDINEFLK
jgi:DNA polymerase III alpha subunit